MLFNDLSRELILEFLQYLETERKCSIWFAKCTYYIGKVPHALRYGL